MSILIPLMILQLLLKPFLSFLGPPEDEAEKDSSYGATLRQLLRVIGLLYFLDDVMSQL